MLVRFTARTIDRLDEMEPDSHLEEVPTANRRMRTAFSSAMPPCRGMGRISL